MKKRQPEPVRELCNVRGDGEEVENNPLLQVRVSGNRCYSTLLSCDSDAFIEEAMEVFNRKHFLITFSKNILVQIQSLAHSYKISLKRGIVIEYYKMAYPKFQQGM